MGGCLMFPLDCGNSSRTGIITPAMKRILKIQAFFLLLVSATVAPGHPVAYQGASQWMTGVSGDAINFEIYHSYTARAAWGLHSMAFDRPENDAFLALQHNWLLKRWNLPDAQANIYAGIKRFRSARVVSRRAP